jgi:L-threonylcarbamoyladenylate synthase
MSRIVPATSKWIAEAAEIIRNGGLAAFPTETVYGLGADALSDEAVRKIFAAKGRPSTNPLIVHIAAFEEIEKIAFANSYAKALADRFWPGPLTMVLPKKEIVPDSVTAGGETVGIRFPRNIIAQELIRKAQTPIAAPSANRSEHISPTRAEHVAESLGDHIDLILNGGACDVGLESTVIDLVSDPPKILRPGQIHENEIEAVLGVRLGRFIPIGEQSTQPSRSPGQMKRHYAPDKPCEMATAKDILETALQGESNLGLIMRARCENILEATQRDEIVILPIDSDGYGAQLYDALHRLDENKKVSKILIEEVPEQSDWEAIRDRLRRACAKKRTRL